ncbi:MAG: glycoside hydrolase family 3 C-terminal domain-containing protein [Janthinobacterium lividum]
MLRTCVPLFLLASTVPLSAAAQSSAVAYTNPSLTPEVRAHDLVSRMTLEEKAAQTLNTAPAISRLGIPAYDYWNEGLHGVARSGYSTLFPQAIGMAATWDAPLLGSIGEVVSTEARAKYNEAIRNNVHSIYFGLTIWSPNINIFRDPRWGRGQETYGEDPFLTARLGLNFIRGLQGPDPSHPRVIATPKHFAVHSGPESDRHRFNVEPTAHDLWDTYLPQFRTAIVDGKADSIMCAYNAIDGKPACASDLLLQTTLRSDWKFTGFVTSDCGAVDDFFEKNAHAFSPNAEHAAATALLTGTDTNCGSTYKALPAAVHRGLLSEADVDRAVERLFEARFRLGMFDLPASVPYAQIPYSQDRAPEHLALSLKAAEEAIVLLKNDGILPLRTGKYKTIAVIGPNAASLSALEGNYNAVPKDPQMPVDALREAFHGAHVIYAQGAPYADGVPVPVPSTMLRETRDGAEEGLRAEYFAATSGSVQAAFTGKPVLVRRDSQIDFDWNSASPTAGLQQNAFAVRWTGYLTPQQAGDFDFNMRLAHCYPCGDREQFRVMIDGKEVSGYATTGGEGRESTTPPFHVRFSDTKPHPIEIDYTHDAPLYGGGITLEWVPPPSLLQHEAVKAIQSADLVIAMMGLSPELEGEEMKIQVEGFAGGDRTDIKLPAAQTQLLEAVTASGKPSIAIFLNGSALALNYAQDHANAVVEAWYPGEFGGKAIAATLLGSNNPAGRLPITFYRSVSDLPAFTDYSMKNRTYRYFTGTPLYSFGYGLSYSNFEYSNLKLSQHIVEAGSLLTAEVEVRNTSLVAGNEVAECYLLPPAAGNGGLSPHLQLAGFQRIALAAGEQRTLRFTLSSRELSEVNANGVRSVQPGVYSLSIGGSEPNDPRAATATKLTTFRIHGSAELPH